MLSDVLCPLIYLGFLFGIPLFVMGVLPQMLSKLPKPKFMREWESQRRQKMREKEKELMLHPDYPAFQSFYGCPVPATLRALYDSGAVLMNGFEVASPTPQLNGDPWIVSYYCPIHARSFIEGPDDKKYFHLAGDGMEGDYVIDPTEGDDPPVYFYYEGAEEREDVCEKLSELLTWPRADLLENPIRDE